MAGPAWLCLNGYLQCISYPQSPPTLYYAATVDSIFKCSFLALLPSFRSFTLFLSFSHTHTHACTHAHTSKRPYRCLVSTFLFVTIPLKIVNCLHPLPPIVYCDYGSYNPTSMVVSINIRICLFLILYL
jgi:hypothetical protein